MKIDKWTVALAALGAVSLASVAKAEEKPTSSVMTAFSGTTLSGYLDTSAQWNLGTGNAYAPPYKFGGASKADGFNLNVVQLRLDKAEDETDWAAGYRLDLWAGPDANTLGTQSSLATGSSDLAIRQAYVKLRMPLGNGIEWKVGVFDSIIGYESVASPEDPNYTRSYGHTIEPQTHTGILASYQFCDSFKATVGVADTMGASINSRAQDGGSGMVGGPFQSLLNLAGLNSSAGPTAFQGQNAKAESYKTYMGAVDFKAPKSMGFLADSHLYGGIVNGFNNSVLGSGVGVPVYNAFVGATLATPIKDLRVGFAFDEIDIDSKFQGAGTPIDGARINASAWSVAGYATAQLTEKFSLHGRCEYVDARVDEPVEAHANILATTVTAQYDLWKNVISRVELRWDRNLNGKAMFGGSTATGPDRVNAFMLAANIIYQF
jgi:hypothetical protein